MTSKLGARRLPWAADGRRKKNHQFQTRKAIVAGRGPRKKRRSDETGKTISTQVPYCYRGKRKNHSDHDRSGVITTGLLLRGRILTDAKKPLLVTSWKPEH